MSENQKNYVGSSFVSDYKGEFNGFTTYFTLADLEELKKFMSEDGRVGVGVRFAKDPTKAYATMFTPKVREPKAEEAPQSTGAADDLPF
jgi:hypothetical protein